MPGNRDYSTAGAAGYFDYFNGVGAATGPAGNRDEGYYSFDLGAWHLIALNTNCTHVACAAGSAQERWLRADLAAHPTACTLAYMHAGRFSSGRPGGALSMAPLYRALYEGGADVALAGHARHYERFAPQTSVGRSPAFGIRQFVVGTGGYSLGPDRRRQEEQRGARELDVRRAGADAPAGRLLVALHRTPGRDVLGRRQRRLPRSPAAAQGEEEAEAPARGRKGKSEVHGDGHARQRRAARHQRT